MKLNLHCLWNTNILALNLSYEKKELLIPKPGQPVQHYLWCAHMSTLNTFGLFHFLSELRLADVKSINPLWQSISSAPKKKTHVAQKKS